MDTEQADRIRIKPGMERRLIVLLPFSQDRVAKIKTVAGRRWHSNERYWTVPRTDEMVACLLTLFAGDRVDLDSALASAGTAPPVPQALLDASIFDRVREAARARHFSPRTEEAYLAWIRRFAANAGRRPEELGERDIGRFLSSLALDARVSASTQNQALPAATPLGTPSPLTY